MDRADALRLVVFEYLLPLQRGRRVRAMRRAFALARVGADWAPERHLGGIFEVLHYISEHLLQAQGFATSYMYPLTMQHENGEVTRRPTVNALVDSAGPYVWNVHCPRPADPVSGFRVFRPGRYMSAGRFFNGPEPE